MISTSWISLKKQSAKVRTLGPLLAMDVISAFQMTLINGKDQKERFVTHTLTYTIDRIAENLRKNSMAVRQIEVLLRFANGKYGSWYFNELRAKKKVQNRLLFIYFAFDISVFLKKILIKDKKKGNRY